MSLTIKGVPETITRDEYTNLFRAVGFEPGDIAELRFDHAGIHAVVLVRDEDGKLVANRDNVATHDVFIRVVNATEDE